MKVITCDIHMFELNQTIMIVDYITGEKQPVAIATLEELPEIISAICDNQKIYKVVLTGNSIFGAAVAEDLTTYSKQHYSWNNLEIEVK